VARCRQPRLCAFAAIPRAGPLRASFCEPNSTREPGDRAVFDMRHIEHCCAVCTECVLCVSRVCDTDSCVARCRVICCARQAGVRGRRARAGLSPPLKQRVGARTRDGRVTGPRRTQTTDAATNRTHPAPKARPPRAGAGAAQLRNRESGAGPGPGRGAVRGPDVSGECI
jgi:hypothetical protein